MNYALDKANSVFLPYLSYNYDILIRSMFFLVNNSASGSGDILFMPCMNFVTVGAS